VDGVIDKDRASAVLALNINAPDLLILTSVPCVSLAFGTPDQRDLDRLTLEEVRGYMAEGHFPPGNMGPKVEAAIGFLEGGGERVFIGAVDRAGDILAGRSGTLITG
jgi:carbamate kinase